MLYTAAPGHFGINENALEFDIIYSFYYLSFDKHRLRLKTTHLVFLT